MRARELGRKSVVVGDRVGLVGDISGAAGRAGPHRADRRAHVGAAAHRRRRRHHRRGPAGAGRGRQRRPARDRQRAGRPAAAHRVHRPVPGGRVRRRHRAAALPDQGRPGRPGRGAGLLRRAGPAVRAVPAGRATSTDAARARWPASSRCWSATPGWASRRWSTGWSRTRAGRSAWSARSARAGTPRPARWRCACRGCAARTIRAGSSTRPGIRSFGLAHVSADSLLHGFPDLVEGTLDCPPNCEHTAAAADCALDAWVAAGRADPRRLASYRRLLASRAGEDDG